MARRTTLAYPASPVAPAPAVDLSDRVTRERLSGPGLRAFFNVMVRWQVKDDDARLLLGGTIRKAGDLTPDDWRLQSPRYQGDNLAHNVALVEKVESLAKAKGCSSAQLAIAWALAQGEDIVPIPGTKRITYLEQNLAALDIELTPDDLAALDAVTPAGSAAAGDRYQSAMMGYLNG